MKAIFISADGLKSYPEKIQDNPPRYFIRPVLNAVRVRMADGSTFTFPDDHYFNQRTYELVDIKEQLCYYKEIV